MTDISQPFFPYRNIFHFSYAEEFLPMKAHTVLLNVALNANWPKKKKEAIGRARRVLQCCQLPERSSRDVREVFGIFRCFKILSSIIIPRFAAERLTVFCRILVGKHWTSPRAGWLKNRASTCSRGRDMSVLHNTQTSYLPPPPTPLQSPAVG